MFFKVRIGLFKLDIIDHHAILGLPVNVPPKQIRLRALKIVQRLHPDTCKSETTEEKELANQLLSRLVNPSYQELFQDKSRAEHQLLLNQLGKRLATEEKILTLVGEPAKELNQAKSNVDAIYQKLVDAIAADQYSNLGEALNKIGMLSELNLVYLTKKAGEVQPQSVVQNSHAVSVGTRVASTPKPTDDGPLSGPLSAPLSGSLRQRANSGEKKGSPVETYIRRAQEYLEKNKFNEARLELQDAIKLDPKNSLCPSLMAQVYLKQNQMGMARVYLKKALEINPSDPIALQIKPEIDKYNSKDNDQKAEKPKPQSKFLEMLFKKL